MGENTLRKTDENVVILPGAAVVGDVRFGPDCSVWFNAVLRGDENTITLGRGCNVQDCAVLHCDAAGPVVLGDWVTVGHAAVVHGCTVGDNTVVGMGAVILNGARIGANCMVGGGAVVTGKMDAPEGSLLAGNPAKVLRALTPEEIAGLRRNAEEYARLKEGWR